MNEGLVTVEHYEEATKEVQAFLFSCRSFCNRCLTFLAVGKVPRTKSPLERSLTYSVYGLNPTLALKIVFIS